MVVSTFSVFCAFLSIVYLLFAGSRVCQNCQYVGFHVCNTWTDKNDSSFVAFYTTISKIYF